MQQQRLLATAAQNSVACICLRLGNCCRGNLSCAPAVRKSHILRQRRVCDACPQTSVRQHPVLSDDREPPPRPASPPKSNKTSCCRRNRSGPVALSSFSWPNAAHGTTHFRNAHACSRPAIGRTECAEGDHPAVNARSPTPDGLRILHHPVRPCEAKRFFKVVTSRTDPRRSSLQPGPAKHSCTPSLILRFP
jgi:hypothetical protein